jgi:hypothetical protein
VRGLPAESATAEATGQQWTRQLEYQAVAIETIDAAARAICFAVLLAASGKKPKLGKPLQLQDPARPGSRAAPKRVTMAEAFGQVRRTTEPRR